MKKQPDFPNELFFKALRIHTEHIALNIKFKVNRIHFLNKMEYILLVIQNVDNHNLESVKENIDLMELDKVLYKKKWHTIEDRVYYESLALNIFKDLFESLYKRFVTGQEKVYWLKEIK